MPRSARPDDLYRLAVATEPAPLAGRQPRRVHGPDRPRRRKDGYRHALWLGPGRRRRAGAAPAHARRPHDRAPRFSPDGRTLAFLSDRRPARRGGAGPAGDAKDARGRRPGPPAAARRRRGAPADRPAARRRRASSGRRTAGRSPSSRRRSARRPRRTAGSAARPRHAEAGRAARVRLPLHRPARLPVQRRRVHLRPGSSTLARRRRDRRRAAADGRADARASEPAWSPGRHADRVRDATSPRPRPRGATASVVVDVATGERSRRHRRPRADLRPCRPGCPTADDRRARRPLPRRRLPHRHLAVRRRRLRRGAARRPEPARPARPHARVRR